MRLLLKNTASRNRLLPESPYRRRRGRRVAHLEWVLVEIAINRRPVAKDAGQESIQVAKKTVVGRGDASPFRETTQLRDDIHVGEEYRVVAPIEHNHRFICSIIHQNT